MAVVKTASVLLHYLYLECRKDGSDLDATESV